MDDHARVLVVDHDADGGEPIAMRDFRKHTSWYLTGYPVGGEMRRRFAQVSTLAELDDLIAAARPDDRARRRAASGSGVATPTARSASRCPDGYLDDGPRTTSPCPTTAT